ncbi:MAG TPA: nucleotidyltransferase domain-containing protein [Thermoanaerobaculia bacterium]|nr:nucleotidyltransferase domain-containing protein [Thermoanaerobaculia bacterium]
MIDPEPYRREWERRRRERHDARERQREECLERVTAAVREVAPRVPEIAAVYLFGSVLQPGRFTEGSDVDVAVDCGDPAAESTLWRLLEEEIEADIDLRRREGAIARAVEHEGWKIYER